MRRCGHGEPQCEPCRISADRLLDEIDRELAAIEVAAAELALAKEITRGPIATIDGVAIARYVR